MDAQVYGRVMAEVNEGLLSRSRVAVGATAHLPRLLMRCKAGYVDFGGEIIVRKDDPVELQVVDQGGGVVTAASFHEYARFLVGEMCFLESAFARALGDDRFDDLDEDGFFADEFVSHIESLVGLPDPFLHLFQRGFSSYLPMDITRAAQAVFDRATAVRAVFLQRAGAVDVADVALEFLVGSAGRDLASFLLPDQGAVQKFMHDLGYSFTETFEEVGPAVFIDTHVRDTVVGVQADGKFSGNSDGYAYEPVWKKWRVAREGEFDESDDDADANESYHMDY